MISAPGCGHGGPVFTMATSTPVRSSSLTKNGAPESSGHGPFSTVRWPTGWASSVLCLMRDTVNCPRLRWSEGPSVVADSEPHPANWSCSPTAGGASARVTGTMSVIAELSLATARSLTGDWRTSTTWTVWPPGSLSFSFPTVTVITYEGRPPVRTSLTSWKQCPAVTTQSGAMREPLQAPLRTPPSGVGMFREVSFALNGRVGLGGGGAGVVAFAVGDVLPAGAALSVVVGAASPGRVTVPPLTTYPHATRAPMTSEAATAQSRRRRREFVRTP